MRVVLELTLESAARFYATGALFAYTHYQQQHREDWYTWERLKEGGLSAIGWPYHAALAISNLFITQQLQYEQQ